MEQESSKQRRSLNINNNNEKEQVIQPEPVTHRRLSRQQQSNDLTSSTNDLSISTQQEELSQDRISKFLILIFDFQQKKMFLSRCRCCLTRYSVFI
jgi:hypothetical protein